MKVKPGDWIRFYSCGRLTISEVRYVRKSLGVEYYDTDDCGNVPEVSVLEVRGKCPG